MQKRKLTRTDRRFLAYAEKLRILRQYVSGFDGKNWEQIYLRRTDDKDVQAERFRQIMRVVNKYSALKPFLVGSKKRVAPKSSENLQALRQYAQLPNIKGLRAVPVEVSDPAKLRVKFSKVKVTLPPAKGHVKKRIKNTLRVKIREGHFVQEFYAFPRSVASLLKQDGPAELADNLLEMLQQMMERLPKGWYLFKHKQYTLLEPKGTNETFPKQARFFIEAYSQQASYVITSLTGVVRLASDADEYNSLIRQMRDARSRAQHDKAKQKMAAREKNMRRFIKRKKRK